MTRHHKHMEFVARQYGFSYSKADDEETLVRILDNFFKPDSQPKILEVDTMERENAQILKNYFASLK